MAQKKKVSTQERIEKYETMVKNLEGYARRQPSAYRFRVGLLAALGYVYVLLILAFALTVAVGTGYALLSGHLSGAGIKVELVALVFCGIILKALWVRMPPPDEGIALDRKNAAPLFAMLDAMTAKLHAPKFHHVLLNIDFNAGVMQVPRLGIFGWQRNYLLLGLPLMEALSPEQFQAALAHEIGHLSGNHSKFAGWIYRVRLTWSRLLESLDESAGSSVIFTAFFNWYAPFFSAYSFALARADEYEADRCAVQMAGAKHIADALTGIHLSGRLLSEDYWPAVYALANQQPLPPAAPISGMTLRLRAGAAPDKAAVWLSDALREKTSFDDTHPSLTDRLSAIGCLPGTKSAHPALPDRLAAMGYDAGGADSSIEAALPPPLTETAAERYLGPNRQAFTERLNRQWQQQVAPVWKLGFEEARQNQQKLAELEGKAAYQPLTEEEAWQRAQWVEEFRGSEAAIALYQEMLRTNPRDTVANFALGRLLLEKGEASGMALLESTMAEEPGSVFSGCQIIYGFLMKEGREAEAETYRRRYLGHADQTEEARHERSHFGDKDTYTPHDISAGETAALAAQLDGYPWIREALLVRKAVTLFAEKPCFLLGIIEDHAWYQMTSDEGTAKQIQQLAAAVQFPHEMHILVLSKRKNLNKKLRTVPNALVYRKR